MRHLLPGIVAYKHHRQDSCGLEVLGNKVTDNKVTDEGEDISHEEEHSEILVVDGDDNHAPVINMSQ